MTDTASPDFPPGSELIRDVGNNCVVLPNELPGVVGVTGIGPSGVLAALIRAAHPNMPPGAVEAIPQNTAMPKDCPTPAEMDPLSGALGGQTCSGGPGYTNFYGKGLVDALAAGSA